MKVKENHKEFMDLQVGDKISFQKINPIKKRNYNKQKVSY